MTKYLGVAALAFLLLLLAGCSAAGPRESTVAVSTATLPPAQAQLGETPLPSATPLATHTPAPSPSATALPTLPPPTPTLTRTPLPGVAPSGQVLATIEAIEFEVEFLRGLEGRSPITRTLITRDELARYLVQWFEEDYTPQELAVDTRVLAAFNFVPENIDLRQILLDLYTAQVLGVYDEELDTLFVVSDGEFDLMDRLTAAHEYVHGLQDQAFGLEDLVDDDRLTDDQSLARMALIEGDATLAMTEYLIAHMTEFSQADLQSLLEEDGSGSQAALEAAPAIIRETLEFPYTYGADFVMALQESGWQAVDAAYADLPESTEQILHLEKYLERDEPQVVSLPPLTETLGIGWQMIDSEALGEFQTILYLAQQMDRATAEQAAAGWDGDRYAVYGRDDDDLLVLVTLWDSEADRDEFVAAYRQYATGRYGQDPARAEGSLVWWQTASQVTALSWQADRTLVVVGPDAATVEAVLAAFAP